MQSTLFGFPTFGIMVCLGNVLGYFVAVRLAKREGLSADTVVDLGLILIGGGLLGCRAFSVIENWDWYFSHQPWTEIFRFDRGGMSWYGAPFVLIPVLAIYFRVKKLHAPRMLDFMALAMPVAQFIGRLGCFFNGCCWGPRCETGVLSSVAVRFPTNTPVWEHHIARHFGFDRPPEHLAELVASAPPGLTDGSWPVLPTQLAMSAAGLVVAATIWFYYGRHKTHGQVFLATMALICFSRFLFEFVRSDSPILGPLSLQQWLSLAFTALAIAGWRWIGSRGTPYTPRSHSHTDQPISKTAPSPPQPASGG